MQDVFHQQYLQHIFLQKKLLLWMILTQLMWNEASAASFCSSTCQPTLGWMNAFRVAPNNSDHQTNYQFSVEDPQPKKNEAPLTVEAGILGRGVRLHPRYASPRKRLAEAAHSARCAAWRTPWQPGGPAVFFGDDGAHRFWGPRSPADDMFWQQEFPMQK